MKTISYVIYRSNSSGLDTFLGTEKKKKNSLKLAAKVHGGQSELPERYLKMTVLMML